MVFLFKRRTGNSIRLLASILQIEHEQLISEYSTAVMKSFDDVLPHYCGIAVSARDGLIKNHTTEIAETLFEAHEHLFLICNDTHAHHQKSSNNEFKKNIFWSEKSPTL